MAECCLVKPSEELHMVLYGCQPEQKARLELHRQSKLIPDGHALSSQVKPVKGNALQIDWLLHALVRSSMVSLQGSAGCPTFDIHLSQLRSKVRLPQKDSSVI